MVKVDKIISVLGNEKEVGKFVKAPQKISYPGLSLTPKLLTDVVEISKKIHSYENILTKEIFEKLLSSGKDHHEMAKELGVSIATVKKYLKKFGLYTSTKECPAQEIKLDKATLQEMIDKNISARKMASELGITPSTLDSYLKEHNLSSNAQKKYRLCKAYSSATTEADKAKALAEIDIYLEQIAQEEFKLKKDNTYEDCLQNVRLRFLETINQKENNFDRYNPISTTQKSIPPVTNEVETVSIEKIRDTKADIPVSDSYVEKFEASNFDEHLWKFIRTRISPRQYDILKQHIKEGKTTTEIAEKWHLTPDSVQVLINKAISRIKKSSRLFSISEHLNKQ